MMRQSFAGALKPTQRFFLLSQKRHFAISALRMGEGDTGGMRSGGAAQRYFSLYPSMASPRSDQCLSNSDSFNKREKANEDMAIRNREKEKYFRVDYFDNPVANPLRLMNLKAKIEAQQKHLKELSEHL